MKLFMFMCSILCLTYVNDFIDCDNEICISNNPILNNKDSKRLIRNLENDLYKGQNVNPYKYKIEIFFLMRFKYSFLVLF